MCLGSFGNDGEGREELEQLTFSLPLVDVDEWLLFQLVEYEVSHDVDQMMSFVKVPVSSLL